MSTQATRTDEDAEALRRRIAALEEEQADRLAAAHAALAEAQDRLYWLDRWGVDLNRAMARPGAVRARFVLRGVRTVARAAIKLKRGGRELPDRARGAYARTEMEARDGDAAEPGPLAARDAPQHADLVADGFSTAGAPFEPGMRCLDFGCASGGVVGALAAAFDDCEWHGCDPSEEAIEQARRDIDGVEFLYSPKAPPLPYGDGAFDRVYATSTWAHLPAPAATAWLEEMHRITRPGGALLLSTQGWLNVLHRR